MLCPRRRGLAHRKRLRLPPGRLRRDERLPEQPVVGEPARRAGEPQRGNNCYMLEVQKNWKGFSVEYGDSDQKKRDALKSRWKEYPERKNKIYWDDAMSFDYKKGLLENKLNNDIDFLSCDIDPQESTFIVLKYTSFGLRLKATGANESATQRFYFSSSTFILMSFFIAGSIAGLAGFSQASGAYHKLVPSISGGFGFLSILIVLICSRNIYFTLIISFLFSALIVGGSQLQIKLGLDHSLIGIIQATFVLSWLILEKLRIENFILNRVLWRNN